MSEPDWDTYYCKHCARYYGWLPASKEFMKGTNKKTIKYFTLCATQAIDIFMLEMEEILLRDNNGNLPNVVICEGDPGKVPEIFRVVRPPISEAIITGKLQDVLSFEDDEFTKTASLNAYERDPKKRERLRLKRDHERLKLYFPFDIINFDPCDSLFNPNIDKNRLYKALEEVFELQKLTDKFLFFVTTPIFNIPPDTQKRLRSEFQENLSRHPEIAKALQSSIKVTQYDEINIDKQMAIAVSKSIVVRAARSKGWDCRHKGIYIYQNETGHKILSSVAFCSCASSAPSESSYVEDIVRVIKEMPTYYAYSESSKDTAVKGHLDKIVKFRNKSK